MADAYVSTTTQSNTVAGAVDLYIRGALRHDPLLRSLADVRPRDVNNAGSSVTLYKYPDLAPATTPLAELTDPDVVALGQATPVVVPLDEYGLATIASVRVKHFSFSNIEKYQMDQVAYNLRDTLDTLVSDVLNAGSNVLYANGKTATNTVTSQDNITATDLRKAVTKLRASAVKGKRGDLYWCGIHPDVSFDLKEDTGPTGWMEAHKYAAPDVFWPNEVGTFAGCFIVESARMVSAADGGEGTDADANPDTVYRTLIVGAEALAEAVADEPHVEIGVVPDRLNRFFPMGWRGILGWNLFREEALYRIEAGSSLNS